VGAGGGGGRRALEEEEEEEEEEGLSLFKLPTHFVNRPITVAPLESSEQQQSDNPVSHETTVSGDAIQNQEYPVPDQERVFAPLQPLLALFMMKQAFTYLTPNLKDQDLGHCLNDCCWL